MRTFPGCGDLRWADLWPVAIWRSGLMQWCLPEWIYWIQGWIHPARSSTVKKKKQKPASFNVRVGSTYGECLGRNFLVSTSRTDSRLLLFNYLKSLSEQPLDWLFVKVVTDRRYVLVLCTGVCSIPSSLTAFWLTVGNYGFLAEDNAADKDPKKLIMQTFFYLIRSEMWSEQKNQSPAFERRKSWF